MTDSRNWYFFHMLIFKAADFAHSHCVLHQQPLRNTQRVIEIDLENGNNLPQYAQSAEYPVPYFSTKMLIDNYLSEGSFFLHSGWK